MRAGLGRGGQDEDSQRSGGLGAKVRADLGRRDPSPGIPLMGTSESL